MKSHVFQTKHGFNGDYCFLKPLSDIVTAGIVLISILQQEFELRNKNKQKNVELQTVIKIKGAKLN